ncbi:hypothetical protein KGA66_06175 [Actinocrinis puniceicyclus]|uniref:Uncharacterized protein n=1 Tax=Actinocrinis puniceicyclus TaxID=977794 RepID=A0A8J7WI04_9ACTN|nr:hypothetical protein [Actinocrinis puniceicyclus]MBS2962626.1 hypothetical protein [Actinocrinis puniceicyclus]
MRLHLIPRGRPGGKHGHAGDAPATLGELLAAPVPQLPVHARMFSDSTEAWMRQAVENDRAQAGDYASQAEDLLERAAFLRRRAADFEHYLQGATPATVPGQPAPVHADWREHTQPLGLADVLDADNDDAVLYGRWTPEPGRAGDTQDLARLDGAA